MQVPAVRCYQGVQEMSSEAKSEIKEDVEQVVDNDAIHLGVRTSC